MKNKLAIKAVLLLSLIFLIAACSPGADEKSLTASGSISAAAVDISPEVSGKIKEVYIKAGDEIQVGDPLFLINDEFIRAQYQQATAGLAMAEAGLTAAMAQKTAAEVQLAQAAQGARYQELQTQLPAQINWDELFELPQWYFTDLEMIDALQQTLLTAQTDFDDAQQKLEKVLADVGNQALIDLEKELAQTQLAYVITQQQLAGYQFNNAGQDVIDNTQEKLDDLDEDLTRSQSSYDRMLTDDEYADVLDARAGLQTAQDRLDITLLALDQLQVGDQSLLVAAAKANVGLAEANIAQAQAGLEQAQAAEALLALQLEKATVYAPLDGIILSESLAVGELLGAGMKALTIAQLDVVDLTVYIPEDQYGRISLGQTVQVTVDSFPDRTFTGEVIYIADQAEFTPRNVQTVEGRKATVFAIKIMIPNPAYELKPGMPADVQFD